MSGTTLPCSDASRAAGEPLAGTAVHATRWLLLEVPGAWPRDVSDGAVLPGPARLAALHWLESAPPARLLFVRRPGRAVPTRLVFAVTAEESATRVRRLELERLEDLSDADLESGGEEVDTPLALVCGHGSRDRCCALRGTALLGALAAHLPEDALWISSHQGGHRFAGNVLVLAAGIQLGRVDPDNAVSVVEHALEGRIDLDHYRGRTCFPPAVQAAEHALRARLGLRQVDDVRLEAFAGSSARFRTADGSEHAVEVEEATGPAVPASCGAEPESQRAFAVSVG